MPTIIATLAEVIDRLCDAFNQQDVNGVVDLFAPDGIFEDLTGTMRPGHAAIRDTFTTMFATDPTAHYTLDQRIIEPPNKALIVWRKSSQTDTGTTWWSGLDVLTFDDAARITMKSVYAKTATPLLHRDQNLT